jgi:glycosyltransferase 2 family protein
MRPLYRLIQSCIIASFFRQFLPSTIGGDAIRAYDSWKMGASKTVAVSTLAVDRVFGLVILLLFAVIAILFSPRVLPEIPLLPMWIALGAGCLFSLLLLIFLPGARLFRPLASIVERLPRPIGDVVNMLSGSLVGFRGQPGLMLRSLGLSFLLQLNVVFFYVLIGTALGLSVPLLAYFIFVPLATIVMMLPVSINAIGLREAVFVVLLGAFGVSMAEALAFAWLEYGLFLFYGLVGGVLYALRR